MPITGSDFAPRAPVAGRATASTARPAAPARGRAPSALGPMAPSLSMLSVQSAPSRAGQPLPHLHARVSTVSVTRDERRRQPRIVRLAGIRREQGACLGA